MNAWALGGALLGVVALIGAGMFAIQATRMRRQGELLLGSLPKPLDEALADVRRSRKAVSGIFQGQLGTEDEVTSPGGVVCAFYEAEVREPAGPGRRGPLISTERGYGQSLWLRGHLGEAMVSFSPRRATGRSEVHRTTVLLRLADASGRAAADVPTPVEAISWEKLGRKGDTCLVAGQLRPGPREGSFEIRGPGGGPAAVVLGEDFVLTGQRVLRLSWKTWAIAAGLCVTAAMLLS